MVQARTRIMNQLQAVALNEGLRCKKKLWREHGREQLENIRLAPWTSRRREDLLQLLDRLNPTIAELTQAIEREAEKSRQAQLPECFGTATNVHVNESEPKCQKCSGSGICPKCEGRGI